MWGKNKPLGGGGTANARVSYFRQDEAAQLKRTGAVNSHKVGQSDNGSAWARNAAYRNKNR